MKPTLHLRTALTNGHDPTSIHTNYDSILRWTTISVIVNEK